MFSARIAPLSLTLLLAAFFSCTTSTAWAQPKKLKEHQETERIVPSQVREDAPPKKAKGKSAIIPTERFDKVFVDRHQANLARAQKGNIDVLFLGDGLMHGWDTTGKPAFKKHFGTLKTANFGIEKDRTENVLWRITTGKELEGIDPKVVVLMIGSNNIFDNSSKEIGEAVVAITESIRTKLPKTQILLMPVLPRQSQEKKVFAVNFAFLALLPKMPGTTLREDVDEPFLDKNFHLKKALYAADTIQLNPLGYEVWAAKIDRNVHTMAGVKTSPVSPKAGKSGIAR